MDGNGRWAQSKGRPRIFGHIHGSNKVRTIVKECGKAGIAYLTLFAFSSENWGRPKEEVQKLMGLLCKYLSKELNTLIKENIRFNYIGDVEKLPPSAQDILKETVKKTSANTGLCLTFALSYGSRNEILRATKLIAKDCKDGLLSIDAINEDVYKNYLYTYNLPDPDLIIRTSGESRLSNFLLWQAAYAEIYVSPKYWPEFSKADLKLALQDYSKRKRRFGLIGAQATKPNEAQL
ncbi:MAG: isoprenyl transferase [Oligoflexia bacterium]|nr:isoprenyl transferase [Oligoflexia bacterium]